MFEHHFGRRTEVVPFTILRLQLILYMCTCMCAILFFTKTSKTNTIVRGARDSRATLMPIYGDLYQIKL